MPPKRPGGRATGESAATAWPLKALLAAASLALTLLAMEVGVRLFAPQDLSFYDWTKIKHPSTLPWMCGYEMTPGTYSPDYDGVPVRINSLGMRDRETGDSQTTMHDSDSRPG